MPYQEWGKYDTFLFLNYFVCLKFCCLLCYSCPAWGCVKITYLVLLLPSEQQFLCSCFSFFKWKPVPMLSSEIISRFFMTVFEIHVDCVSKVPVAHSLGNMPAFIYIWKQASKNLNDLWLYKLFLKLFITANPGILTPMCFAAVTCQVFILD